jgi:hypothetical protein
MRIIFADVEAEADERDEVGCPLIRRIQAMRDEATRREDYESWTPSDETDKTN